jgi:hypothetical protein
VTGTCWMRLVRAAEGPQHGAVGNKRAIRKGEIQSEPAAWWPMYFENGCHQYRQWSAANSTHRQVITQAFDTYQARPAGQHVLYAEYSKCVGQCIRVLWNRKPTTREPFSGNRMRPSRGVWRDACWDCRISIFVLPHQATASD